MTEVTKQTSDKVIYPELSYKLIGIMFDVYNELGGGLKEKIYENAAKEAFKKENIGFKQQLYIPVMYKEKNVGKYFLDFLVEEQIVLELKVGDRFRKTNIDQIYQYLKSTGLKLGILVNFDSKEVKYKRILNIE